jgi:hypothetical protein
MGRTPRGRSTTTRSRRTELLPRDHETERKELQAKPKELEEKRKSLLVETHRKLEVTLDQQRMCPGELEVTKEWLHLPLLQLALTKDEETFPHCLEKRAKGEQSLRLDFETKRKEQDNQRKEEEKTRKNEMKMTKSLESMRK